MKSGNLVYPRHARVRQTACAAMIRQMDIQCWRAMERGVLDALSRTVYAALDAVALGVHARATNARRRLP